MNNASETEKSPRDVAAEAFGAHQKSVKRYEMTGESLWARTTNAFKAGWDARDEEVRRLKEELKSFYKMASTGVWVKTSEYADQCAERLRLREALRIFGHHTVVCGMVSDDECTCGYTASLKNAGPVDGEKS